MVRLLAGMLVLFALLLHSSPTAAGAEWHSVASTGPLGTSLVYADADGVSGDPMTLRFTLAVP